MFTFDGNLAEASRSNRVVCPTNVGSLLRKIAELQVRSLVTEVNVERLINIRFVLRSEVPLVLVVVGIAIGNANQRVFAIFLLASDCAVGSVCCELIKN
jgi:hypothetical protein